jgi:hypothetical protein
MNLVARMQSVEMSPMLYVHSEPIFLVRPVLRHVQFGVKSVPDVCLIIMKIIVTISCRHRLPRWNTADIS